MLIRVVHVLSASVLLALALVGFIVLLAWVGVEDTVKAVRRRRVKARIDRDVREYARELQEWGG